MIRSHMSQPISGDSMWGNAECHGRWKRLALAHFWVQQIFKYSDPWSLRWRHYSPDENDIHAGRKRPIARMQLSPPHGPRPPNSRAKASMASGLTSDSWRTLPVGAAYETRIPSITPCEPTSNKVKIGTYTSTIEQRENTWRTWCEWMIHSWVSVSIQRERELKSEED